MHHLLQMTALAVKQKKSYVHVQVNELHMYMYRKRLLSLGLRKEALRVPLAVAHQTMTEEISLLVTVGSTSFPVLTDFITSPATLATLRNDLHLSAVTVQHGTHAPVASSLPVGDVPLRLQTLSYAPSLHTLMRDATVVVSHAGSGTVLEAVDLCKPLIVVVNSALMDDHQTEIASAMARRQCCTVVTHAHIATHLIPAIRAALSPHFRAGAAPLSRVHGVFAAIVDEEMGAAAASRRRGGAVI